MNGNTRCPVVKKSPEDSLVITDQVLQDVLYGRRRNLLGNPMFPTLKDTMPGIPTPTEVRITWSSLPNETCGVCATVWIKHGTEMGPFCGERVPPTHIDFSRSNDLTWEVLTKDGNVSHFVDASRLRHRNWITYINCARNIHEQNLEIFQIGFDIFYRVTKDIAPDQELLVWYAPTCDSFLGIPGEWAGDRETGDNRDTSDNNNYCCTKDVPNRSSRVSLSVATSTKKLSCALCWRGFNSKSNLRSHMRIHTLEKPFVCRFCDKRFSQSSTLRNHIRLHTGEKPYACTMCDSAYSQLAGLRAHQRSARHRKSGRPVVTRST